MIPENRVCNGSFPIPKLMIGKEEINLFTEEFKGFHAQFKDWWNPQNLTAGMSARTIIPGYRGTCSPIKVVSPGRLHIEREV